MSSNQDQPYNAEAPPSSAGAPGAEAADESRSALAPAPAVASTDHGGKAGLQGGSQLQKQTSTGTWGERATGEPVDPKQAMQDFQLAREESRQSRSSMPRSMGRMLSRSRTGRQSEIVEKTHEGDKSEEERGFDLGEWMLARKAQREEQGVHSEKPLGVSWRNVNVVSPTGAGAKVFVKTLPQAIVNTATRDPINVLSNLIPPLGKMMGPKTTPTPIIHGHDGVLKAGEMLLVLGRPGSGCSTTLRALTNSSHANLTTQGSITYGGLTPGEIARKYRGETIFVDEDDIHFPTMTVEQTLRFALMCKVPHRSSRLRDEGRGAFIDLIIEVLLKMFAMTHVRNTIVGDAAVRGVSGGERKRVTLQEALATDASVMAWDNSTRGLDASTALDYARSLRVITDVGQRTTMATLYQVSESIYDLFDRVSVIDEGLCIYYGPRDQARRYFEELGYYSPPRQTTSDFVCAVTDPNQVIFREGFEKKAPRTAEERESAWKSSQLYKDLLAEVDQYETAVKNNEVREAENLKERVRAKKNKGVRHSSPYTVNYWDQVKACMYRDLLVKWGARGDLYIKFFTIVSVSLMISSLFYKQSMDSTGAFTRGGVVLFACLFNGWLQLSESYEAVAGRPMLTRHGQFAFYRPSAVSISRALVDIPFLVVQCVVSTIIIYFLANLRVNAGAYFIFLVYTFLCAYNLTALYRAFAAFSPGFNEAIRFSVLGLNLIIIFVGYVIRRPQMNWLIWLNYANGISYAFEGMLANEFKYPIECNPSQIVPFNAARDATYQTCSLTGGRPGSLVVTGEDYLSTTFNYSQSSVGPNIGVVIAFSALYLIVTVIASEVMNYGGAGGGVTVFAKTKAAKREVAATKPPNADDTEAAAAPADRTSSHSSSNATPVDSQPPQGGFEQANKNGEKQTGGLERIKTHEDKPIFTWSDIQLELATGRKLLQHVDGYVRPGTLTALMGASGAGKTTLMTALSQRGAAGALSGDMLVDGKPLGPGFQKSTGLVLQADVHLSTQTVREAIEFSALLRQPREVPREEKLRDAQHAIDLLELGDLADALIGTPGAGLGVERRKRVTIAVELAAKPDLLLFLDEPTSGLDSAGAASICRLLRRLAEDGQAILCTIHQPSALLFESFDNVLLLAPGGRTTYFGQIGEQHGHGSDRIRTYFERNGADPCDPTANVAEYILEVVSGGKSKGINWGDAWLNSEECCNVRSEIDQIVKTRKERPEKVDPRAQREFATPLGEQFREVTLRQFKDLWREPSFAYAILFSNFVTGLVAGGAFAHLGLSPTDYQNRVFIEFLVILNFPSVVNSIIAKFFELRMLFEVRESASKIYHWSAMLGAFIVVSAPVAVVSSIIYWLPSFYIPYYSQPSYKAGYFYLMVLLINLFEIEFSLMLAVSSPTPVTAANLLPFMLPILAIVNGVIVPHNMMPQPWKAIYWANPLTYYLKGTIGTMLHGTPVICNEEDIARFNPPPTQSCDAYAGAWAQQAGGYLVNPAATTNCGYCQYSVGDQFAATLSAPFDFRWKAFGIFLCYVAGNVAAAFVLFWWFRIKGYGLGVGPVKKLVMKPFQSKKGN
ncbi:hypothetical protein BDZ90DRAFT_230805 [Jaminaea rosea]|uniref:ABC transporter domain-containing protein n=1 Tax=Jaminaea rosea TaxID=1569628 RepID=A0A316UU10_9BASI|nr:hypothetical protein BDZ90DRAFT_230805 [Jaminaea rosea]PWN28796.1 hypothetical protein BDZ90DRAFT_230805 [Jaminaea rosea]